MTQRHQTQIAKNMLFAGILLLLVTPALQKEFQFIREKPLTGAFVKPEIPSMDSLNWKSWMSGTFQQELTDRLESHIGFHNTLLRAYHQFEFSLYGLAHADGVIAGKKGELFEEDYIRAYMGEFYVGENVWEDKVYKLKALQDTLGKLGKTFAVILEPGKGSLYPDRFPDKYMGEAPSTSNYDVFAKLLQLNDVHLLDLNRLFVQWRDKVPYRLFPRGGTHWSYYGAALAADTMVAYLNELTGGGLPDLRIDTLIVKKEIRHPDDDIWLAMNLFTPAPLDQLAYPEISFANADKAKKKALFVGDSFYFNWQSEGVMHDAFADCNFWYYNKHVWNRSGVEDGLVSSRNLSTSIAENDIIVIMITERFHQNFAWNFDEQLYDLFFPGQHDPIEFFANQVRTNNEHFMRMVADAGKSKQTLVERIHAEAEFLLYEDSKIHPDKYTSRDARLSILMMSIRHTPEWLEKVKAKATERNIPIDEMIRMDAEWILEHP